MPAKRAPDQARPPKPPLLIRFVLRGRTPMLQNRMSQETLNSLPGAPGGSKNRQQNTEASAEEICEEKLYKRQDGHMGMPHKNLFACLREAGRRLSYGEGGKTKVSTADSTKLPEFMRLLTPGRFLPFLGADKDGNVEWEPDMQRGVNKTTKGSTAIVRPEIPAGWELEGYLEFEPDLFLEESMRLLFKHAGNCGLGDFRPECSGDYGMFELKTWEHMDQIPLEPRNWNKSAGKYGATTAKTIPPGKTTAKPAGGKK